MNHSATSGGIEPLLSTKDVAAYFGVSVKTVQNTWRKLPAPVILPSGGKRWRKSDLEQYRKPR